MRRLAALLALAALGLVAGALAAHALHAQAPRDPQDSLALAAGCRLLPGDTPALPTTVHLDSAGIRVWQSWQSAGIRDDGTMLACPRPELAFRFRRAEVGWTPAPIASPGFAQWPSDPPYIRALAGDSAGYALRADLSPLWGATPEEAAGNGHVGPWTGWRTWRDALPVLAAKLHEGSGVPPVSPPATDPCGSAPTSWLPLTDGTVRRDEMRLPRCAAVVLLDLPADGRAVAVAAPVRWAVAWPPCTGTAWRRHPTTYTTRTAALDRARRIPPCTRS